MDTKKAVEVMQAYLEGKVIEGRRNGSTNGWIRLRSPEWNWSETEYRVKPEPKEIYVIEYPDGTFRAFKSDAAVVEFYNHCPVAKAIRTAVKYREVIE